jgi:hypothetical protein
MVGVIIQHVDDAPGENSETHVMVVDDLESDQLEYNVHAIICCVCVDDLDGSVHDK